MRQEVISNADIFNTLTEELLKAKSEIIVVTAWFTDNALFDILLKKQREGLKISIVISDNLENEKIDFTYFESSGGIIKKIAKNGRGMMHQKFCIIDTKLAIHGSYNWTVNARKNNNESVIVTSHQKTINELINTYRELINMNTTEAIEKKTKFKRFFNIIPNKNIIKSIEPDSRLDLKVAVKDNATSFVSDFKNLLDELIESEIFKFDKQKFIKEGFERAKLTNGDHQTLENTLETLYADFVNSLDIAQEKKESLFVKIKELKNSKINKLDLEKDNEINILESDKNSQELILEKDIDSIETKKSQKEIEKDKIRNVEIESRKKKNNAFALEIEELRIASVLTKLRWHELIPAIIISVILLAYIIVFYSSAAYILIFSTLDAQLAQLNGAMVMPAEVFDPQALDKAWNKGGTAPLFMGLFVIIPLGLAIVKNFLTNIKRYTEFLIWIGIILVDSFLAYVVAKSIHEVDYLAGRVNDQWQISNFLKNENFYLVFIMGALGLVIFKFFYEKIHNSLGERNTDVTRAKNMVIIKQIFSKIEKNEKDIKNFENKQANIDQDSLELENKITVLNKELNKLPVTFEREKQFLVKNCNVKKSEIEDVVSIYQSKIENNDLKFSVSALKDRVNTFLEGWINYLNDTYSIHKAKSMSEEATIAKTKWIEPKIITSSNSK